MSRAEGLILLLFRNHIHFTDRAGEYSVDETKKESPAPDGSAGLLVVRGELVGAGGYAALFRGGRGVEKGLPAVARRRRKSIFHSIYERSQSRAD